MGVKVDVSQLTAFKERLDTLTTIQASIFLNDAVREMANWLLSLVIPRTPVGSYTDGRQGGTLRRGWLNNTANQAAKGMGTTFTGTDFSSRANALNVNRGARGGYSITVTNPVYYASYVEHGHRQTPGRYVPAIGKKLKKSWVEGQHFLKISEDELKEISPALLEEMLTNFLKGAF